MGGNASKGLQAHSNKMRGPQGHDEHPGVCCRLVAQETRRRSSGIAGGAEGTASTFAATPPSEGLMLLMGLAMSSRNSIPDGESVSGFLDISRAYFHSPARRQLYIMSPAEHTTCKTDLARLLKFMYGTCDAPECFEGFSEGVMAMLGFAVGLFFTVPLPL